MFADIIIISLPIPTIFTYNIPDEFTKIIKIGSRVIVPFGNKSNFTGIIENIFDKKDTIYNIKDILYVLDLKPTIPAQHLNFLKWIADYYMCSKGEVIKTALPPHLILTGKTSIQVIDTDVKKMIYLNERELKILKIIENSNQKNYKKTIEQIPFKNKYNLLNSLLTKGIIRYEIALKKNKESQKKLLYKFDFNHFTPQEISLKLKTTKKTQEKIINSITAILNESIIYFSKKDLKAKGLTEKLIQALKEHHLLIEFEKPLSDYYYNFSTNETHLPLILSESQQKAKKEIIVSFNANKPVLLHGVTGSGKTEVYLSLIKDTILKKKQVLLLLPEIAITTQIVQRIEKAIGGKVPVYHSKVSTTEKIRCWEGIKKEQISFVIGTRSALFLPFQNLGLIVIDEEHDPSYKQQDPAPRYHARDSAIMLAHLNHASILLGSATPSTESFMNTLNQKYTLVTLDKRYSNIPLPQIELIDITKDRKTKKNQSKLSHTLSYNIEKALHKNEQVLLFQNRRGYSTHLSCSNCEWISTCKNCAVSLTYHLHHHHLECHYCGYHEKLPTLCPHCQNPSLHLHGMGTEKIEEDIELLFPQARVQRMDLDTTRKKNTYQTIINQFESGEIDILIGTQMISKGLDFSQVSIVGILDIDGLMYFPNYRAHERALQTVIQVSGRAGRRNKKGTVIIQTRNIKNPLLNYLSEKDYLIFLKNELIERKKFKYPPFTRLIQLTFKHKTQTLVNQAAHTLKNDILEKLNDKIDILGPSTPIIEKINNVFLKEFFIKINNIKDINKIKKIIQQELDNLIKYPSYKSVTYKIDVDPI